MSILNSNCVFEAAIKQIPLTRIIVAHRPETIGMPQRVVVLQQGGIVQDVLPLGVAETSQSDLKKQA